jgi:hypothetical protein
LVAKLHKLGERTAQADARPDRVIAKDAADIYRLMLHLDHSTAITRFKALVSHPMAGSSTRTALRYLRTLLGAPATTGVRLAIEGLGTDVPSDRVEEVCVGFARAVLSGLASELDD